MTIVYMRRYCLITLACTALFAYGGNATKDTEKNEPQVTKSTPASSKVQVDYDSFKNMDVEQRWHALSAERRNYLRLNPDLYPYFKPMIALEPNMEEVAAGDLPINNTAPNPHAFSEEGKQKTPQEWWDSFSESRKKYMIEHANEYPLFKEIIEKEK